MPNPNPYIQKALEADAIRKPVLEEAIQSLQLPKGSHGLDAGCGIGLQAISLAKVVGKRGHVTGFDISPEALGYGSKLAQQAGLSDQITFREGNVNSLPFEKNSYDWAWSVDCIGYPVGQLTPVLKELARVVKPGGRVILLAWSSQQLLPGYPLLEARLNATCSSYAPYVTGAEPESHFLRALRWFGKAGLEDAKAQTFLGNLQAPLNAGQRAALISLFDMLWGEPQPGVSPEDRSAYLRLCAPRSPDFILDLPGYYAFFTYTMFQGKVTSKARKKG